MSKNKIWTGDFVLLAVISLLAYITCQSLTTGMSVYVDMKGGTASFTGLMILEFSVFASIARIIAGRMIDRGSRKRVLLVGGVIVLVGTFLPVVFPGLKTLIIFRAIHGLGFGIAGTAALTAAADVLPQERMGEGIGFFALGQSLGMAIGPATATVLLTLPFQESLFVGVSVCGALLVVACLGCSYEKHPERLPETSAYRKRVEEGSVPGAAGAAGAAGAKPQEKRGIVSSLFEKDALPGVVPMLFICLGFSIIVTFVALFSAQRGVGQPGVFFLLSAVAMTLIRFFGGKLIDRMAPRVLYAVPIVAGIISCIMIVNPINDVWFDIAGLLFGVAMGMGYPLLNTICMKNTAPERWGAASAFYGLANDAGMGFGALIWGVVADAVGFEPIFYCGAIMLAISYALAFVLFPKGGK